jgi:hypothetical protein
MIYEVPHKDLTMEMREIKQVSGRKEDDTSRRIF